MLLVVLVQLEHFRKLDIAKTPRGRVLAHSPVSSLCYPFEVTSPFVSVARVFEGTIVTDGQIRVHQAGLCDVVKNKWVLSMFQHAARHVDFVRGFVTDEGSLNY